MRLHDERISEGLWYYNGIMIEQFRVSGVEKQADKIDVEIDFWEFELFSGVFVIWQASSSSVLWLILSIWTNWWPLGKSDII